MGATGRTTVDRLRPGAVAQTVLVALGLAALAWLLWTAHDLLFIVFFGILVALFLSALVDPLEARGMPRVAAVLLVLLVLGGLAVGFFLLLWPTVREQLGVVAGEVPRAAADLGRWAQSQYEAVAGSLPGEHATLEARLRESLANQAGALVGGAMPVLNSVLGALAGALVVIMAGIYVAVDPALYRRGLQRLLPPRHRERTTEALDRTAVSLRRWMVGTLVNMVLVGAITWVGLGLLDVPAAMALAVIAGVLEFVPIFGPILAMLPAVAVGLTVSPLTGLWVVLLFTGVQQLESNVITPLVMRGAVRLPPALTLLFQSFMAIAFGFLGLLLAVPILAAALVLVRELYVHPMEEEGGGAASPAAA